MTNTTEHQTASGKSLAELASEIQTNTNPKVTAILNSLPATQEYCDDTALMQETFSTK